MTYEIEEAIYQIDRKFNYTLIDALEFNILVGVPLSEFLRFTSELNFDSDFCIHYCLDEMILTAYSALLGMSGLLSKEEVHIMFSKLNLSGVVCGNGIRGKVVCYNETFWAGQRKLNIHCFYNSIKELINLRKRINKLKAFI